MDTSNDDIADESKKTESSSKRGTRVLSRSRNPLLPRPPRDARTEITGVEHLSVSIQLTLRLLATWIRWDKCRPRLSRRWILKRKVNGRKHVTRSLTRYKGMTRGRFYLFRISAKRLDAGGCFKSKKIGMVK